MLDEGLALSTLRRSTTHMIKTTGRLTFPALGNAIDRVEKVARECSSALELMIDCRRLGFPRRGADARVQLFVCSHNFYDRVLRNANREMNSAGAHLLEQFMYVRWTSSKTPPDAATFAHSSATRESARTGKASSMGFPVRSTVSSPSIRLAASLLHVKRSFPSGSREYRWTPNGALSMKVWNAARLRASSNSSSATRRRASSRSCADCGMIYPQYSPRCQESLLLKVCCREQPSVAENAVSGNPFVRLMRRRQSRPEDCPPAGAPCLRFRRALS